MIDPGGQPVIMRLALARRGLETGDVRLTQSGMIMGAPAYMSPEQVNGAASAMGPACDIYSLGVSRRGACLPAGAATEAGSCFRSPVVRPVSGLHGPARRGDRR